jgi:uncharacterized protein
MPLTSAPTNVLDNRTLWVTLLAWACVQTWKFLAVVIFEHRVDWSMLWAPGGMPSTHSTLVAALATSVGMNAGFGSSQFAISIVLAMIVMYDAAAVRRAAGRQAQMINRIVDELLSGSPLSEERLRELMGHTPFQVLVGTVIGVLAGVLLNL